MKKPIILCLAMIAAMLLTSCQTGNGMLPLQMEKPEMTVGTTYPKATAPEPTAEPTKPEQPTEDLFETFILTPHPNDFGNEGYCEFPPKKKYIPDGMYGGPIDILFVRVIGILEEKSNRTMYNIRFVDVYGRDATNLDREKTLMMEYYGGVKAQSFRNPPLKMGQVYACVSAFDSVEDINACTRLRSGYQLFKPVQENGKWVLYSCNLDFSNMDCKIPVTDPLKNQVYKPGEHDKARAYLENAGQPLPTFDYVCEIQAFVEEVRDRSIDMK